MNFRSTIPRRGKNAYSSYVYKLRSSQADSQIPPPSSGLLYQNPDDKE
jgi:hypothetical protein